jgi:hypothetical protein
MKAVHWCGYLVLTSALTMGGCSCSRFARPPERPARTPQQSAKQAMAEYDTNGDGTLDQSELEQCPGVAAGISRVDTDKDGKVSAAEIAARIAYWDTAPTAIISGATEVTLDGHPLAGATVTFEPEDFLGDAFITCSGETDEHGSANISGHDAEFPGIYLGFYRVRISKVVGGKETIPAKYNTETELGFEASDDLPDISNVIQFHLKTR